MNIQAKNQNIFKMKNSKYSYKGALIMMLISALFSTMVLSAQESERKSIEIYSLDQLSQNTSLRTGSGLPNYIKPENINPLITGLKPSVYMKGGVLKIHGEKPVRAYLDLRSLAYPIARNAAFDNVELVVINIENERDLFSQINLDNLSGFTKLKYIQIVCRVDCNQNQLSAALISSLKNYVIIYSVEKQS